MTHEDTIVLLIKGAISDLSPEDQACVQKCAEKIRAVVAEYGDHGGIALALVGAEAAK